jgi:hypothetical protein
MKPLSGIKSDELLGGQPTNGCTSEKEIDIAKVEMPTAV